MAVLSRYLSIHLPINMAILALSVAVGLLVSVELLGVIPDSQILQPLRLRSVHISLMLYGAIPLLLSFLPFLLIEKETGRLPSRMLHYLNLYALSWYLFLILMVLTLLLGDRRGLPFYDFDYRLNFLLALAGVFYIVALFKAVRRYERLPLWVRVSLGVTLLAPVALLLLMNPVNGPITQTLKGPHGDNTLGMSFALLPIYYLAFKLLSRAPFRARGTIFWILPLGGYLLTLLWRFFVGPLSYEGEWAAQWLTLLYIPLLWRWWRDADLSLAARRVLGISVAAFLFVDLEGNLLFIPQLRWLFHRNDLVVGHAHLAMGLGVGFLALSLYAERIVRRATLLFVWLFAAGMAAMALALSLAGVTEAGWKVGEVMLYWKLRTLFGGVVLLAFLLWIPRQIPESWRGLEWYNLLGFLGDGVGAVVLVFSGEWLYRQMGWPFELRDHWVIFAFMAGTAAMHFLALRFRGSSQVLTLGTALIRFFTGSAFAGLAVAGVLGIEGWGVAAYDLGYAYLYFLFLHSGTKEPAEGPERSLAAVTSTEKDSERIEP